MPDAITDLGHCAAVCELEAHLCPWDRVELEHRAQAYRSEQLRLLALLSLPAASINPMASPRLRALAFRDSQTAGFGAATGCSRKM